MDYATYLDADSVVLEYQSFDLGMFGLNMKLAQVSIMMQQQKLKFYNQSKNLG